MFEGKAARGHRGWRKSGCPRVESLESPGNGKEPLTGPCPTHCVKDLHAPSASGLNTLPLFWKNQQIAANSA